MDSHQLIDTQFDRAVEIVQGLPKTGPIQTGYEEKLTMYSLYKQATVGNVKSPRPGIWDMLGRAKWDAWSKHKDLEAYEAKWLYVEALLKVLRKYSDKTVARDLVQELEAYGGDPSNLVMSSTLSKSPQSDSSGSTASDEQASPPHFSNQGFLPALRDDVLQGEAVESSSDDDIDDVRDPTRLQDENHLRAQSSLSSHRYRTPIGGSLAVSPPPVHASGGIPSMQPMPGFETPSAFAEHSSVSIPSSAYPTTSSYVGQYSELVGGPGLRSSPHVYPSHPQYRTGITPVPAEPQPTSRLTLERAIENVQSHLAALHERLDSLETLSGRPHSNLSLPTAHSSPSWGGTSPAERQGETPEWDLDDMGMWSFVLNPVARGMRTLQRATTFFARNETRSPTLIIVRRLCLDVSFLLCVLVVMRAIWIKSGVRRREIRFALRVLWRAILGTKRKPRKLVDKGV